MCDLNFKNFSSSKMVLFSRDADAEQDQIEELAQNFFYMVIPLPEQPEVQIKFLKTRFSNIFEE